MRFPLMELKIEKHFLHHQIQRGRERTQRAQNITLTPYVCPFTRERRQTIPSRIALCDVICATDYLVQTISSLLSTTSTLYRT